TATRLLRADDGGLIRTIHGTQGDLEDLTFSPDGQLLAISGYDDTTTVATITTLSTQATTGEFNDMAAGSGNYSVRLWRVSDGSLVAQLANEQDNYGSGGKVLDIEFSPDGKIVYGGTDVGTVRMWRVP